MDDRKVVGLSGGSCRDPLDGAPSGRDGDIAGNSSSGRRPRRPPVEEIRRRAYGLSELKGYSWRERLIIRAADFSIFALIKLVGKTLHWQVRGLENMDHVLQTGRRVILTFWHAGIFSGTWFWRGRGIVVMSSRSRDGELTARMIRRFGYGTARGSSSRGSARALVEMSDCLDSGIDVAFTIDGPRGPAFTAKPGAVILARHTGHAVLPFHIAARRYITLPSWDRTEIPLPFSPAIVLVAPPIYVSRGATANEVRAAQESLQRALDGLRKEADEWRRS